MKHVPIPPLFCFCWLTQAPAHPSPPSPRHLRQEDRCHDNHLHLMARGASPLPEMGEVSLSLSLAIYIILYVYIYIYVTYKWDLVGFTWELNGP